MRGSARADAEQGVDTHGIAALYDATLDHIYGYLLLRVGGDAPIAEDLTQETYLALAEQIRSGAMPPAPLPWLLRVARNKLIDFYRRQERTALRIGRWTEEAEQQGAGAEGIERLPDRELLRAALNRLPPGQRLAIALHYLDGLSVTEIARELEKSEHAVESLLARGRTGLRAYLIESEA
jgi:RNA polymerase sigma-70 factor, ECF subfamily